MTSNTKNGDLIIEADLAPATLRADGIPLLAGSDIREFQIGSPSFFASRYAWSRPTEVEERYTGVAVLIRQTARFPIATRSDGTAFRNSILAGFSMPGLSAEGLCAWLNSSAIRWLHFMRFRDAREGMPQVKISHLRRIPAPSPACFEELHGLGARLHSDPDSETRTKLDRYVFAELAVPPDLQREINEWVGEHASPRT